MSGRIGKQLPAVRSIPQVDQPEFVHKRVELGPSTLVQLDIDRNQQRPIRRPRNVNEIERERSNLPRFADTPVCRYQPFVW